MELESWYMVDSIETCTSWETVAQNISHNRILGDLQVVKDSTAEGCLALIDQQASSVGMPRVSSRPLLDIAAILDGEATMALDTAPVIGPAPLDPAPILDGTGLPLQSDARVQADGSGPGIITCYIICTDAGGDEAAARAILHTRASGSLRIWLFDIAFVISITLWLTGPCCC